jgi:hypothetical protein
MFSASIVKKSNNFVKGYPTEFAGSTQKYNEEIFRTPNQPIKSEKINKKVCMATRPNLTRGLKNNKTQVKLKKT